MSKRILHVVGRMDRGGTETMIMNLYRKIDRSKIQFDFMVHTDDICDYDNEIKELGGKIYHINRFTGLNIKSYIKDWIEFFSNHAEYTIIHGHIGSSASIYLRIAKKFGLFTIAHSHNTFNTEKSLKNFVYSLISYPTRYISDFFFACSEQAGIDRYGKNIINSSKFKVINNAINAKEFSYCEKTRKVIREQLGVKDRFVIGHIGRFSSQKNHKKLIEIFKEINKIDKKAILLLVGDGELKQQIENKVIELGLRENVIFAGVRTDISNIVQAMDIFVFPSLYEGLGMVVIEAQAAGLPCIVSDAIQKEAYVTNFVKSISLKSDLDTWISEILNYRNGYERKNNYYDIKTKGYDIDNTVEWIENFYLQRR